MNCLRKKRINLFSENWKMSVFNKKKSLAFFRFGFDRLFSF